METTNQLVKTEQWEQAIIATGRISARILPRTEEQALSTFKSYPLQYFNSLTPKSFNDVFDSVTPSIARIGREFGEAVQLAAITLILSDFVLSFNFGNTMSDRQIADTVREIISDYPMLKVEDLRFCFKEATKERYCKLFRMDKGVILSVLDKYLEDRLNAAANKSMDAHSQATAGEHAKFESIEKLADRFGQPFRQFRK